MVSWIVEAVEFDGELRREVVDMENFRSDALPIDGESGLLLDPDFGHGVAGPIVRSEVCRNSWPSNPTSMFSRVFQLVSHSSAPCGAFVGVLFFSFLFHDLQFPFVVKFRRLLMCVCVCVCVCV